MTDAWGSGEAPHARTDEPGTVTLVEGATFCIADRSGDIRPGAEQGLYFRDTRFLSRFTLDIDGQAVDPLAVQYPAPYAATFVGRRPPKIGTADSTLLVVRRRYVGNGMLEEITVQNLGRETAAVVVTISLDADFAGLFEVKGGRVRPRDDVIQVTDGPALSLGYETHEPGGDSRRVKVTGGGEPRISDRQLTWQPVIAPRDEWTISVEVTAAVDGVEAPRLYRADQPVAASGPATQRAAWRRAAPAVTTPDERLRGLLATTTEDLGSLRIFDPDRPDRAVIAAGAPWFMTLFGRDSLLTSWMLLPVDATLALGTLETLARLQGSRIDPVSEEEPGRILHEIRVEPDAEVVLGSRGAYYGSIDATPLFVMLLGELRRWGVAQDQVEALLGHADRALAWVEQFGDRDGDGFVEYQRATDRGLVNQGWKDSFDAINFATGALAEPPIALAEVQGYVYAAYRARAHFAREAGDEVGFRRWAAKASALKRHFNELFWLPTQGYYALALDGDKRPVDALASNMGHPSLSI